MLTDELLDYLFDGEPHPLALEMRKWLGHSRRYSEFVEAFRTKIRKKLRTTPDPENLLDLRVELETAYLLSQERKLSLVYEPLPPRQQRSPDFAVTYTTSLTFMLEVTRLRTTITLTADEEQGARTLHERLVDTISGKLGQFSAGQCNVLLIVVEADLLPHIDLDTTMRHLQQRAEQNDAVLLQRAQVRSRAEFFRHYQQLSEILVRATTAATGPPHSWINGQAKQRLPSKVRTALRHAHMLN